MEIRRAIILGFTLFMAGLVLCGVGLSLLLSPAQYQATARIMVNIDMPPIGGNRWASFDPYFIQTEFEVIQSEFVLSNVVSILNLNVLWGEKYNAGSPLKTVKTVELLKRRMSLFPIRNTKFIEITFRSENSDEAARIANVIAEAYQDYRLEIRRQLTVKGIEVLQQQYQEEEKKIQIQQTNVDLLREKLQIRDDDSSVRNGSEHGSNIILHLGKVDTNALAGQPYWEAKLRLENMLDFRKVLQSKIAAEKIDLQIPKTSMVRIIEVAQPPRSPAGPNRFLGALLLVIGLFPTIGGFLMLKSARHTVRW